MYKIVDVGVVVLSLIVWATPAVLAQTTPTITAVSGCPSTDAANCVPGRIYPGSLVMISVAGMAAGDEKRISIDFFGDRNGIAPLSATSSMVRVMAPNDITKVTKIRLLGSGGTPDSNDFTVAVGNGNPTPTGGLKIASVTGCKGANNGAPCNPGLVSVGDASITIMGSGFDKDTVVSVNGQNVPVASFTASQLVVNLPTAATAGQIKIIVDAPPGSDNTTVTVGTPSPSTGGGGGGGTTGGGGSIPITPKPVTAVPSDLDCKSQGLGEKTDPVTGLCLPANPFHATEDSLASATSVGDLIKRILNILLTLGGVVAVLFIVLGGYEYITSRGSEERAKSGRKTMTYAIIGLVAILLAFMLVTVLTNLFTQGKLFS